jgi:hypothetical protein
METGIPGNVAAWRPLHSPGNDSVNRLVSLEMSHDGDLYPWKCCCFKTFITGNVQVHSCMKICIPGNVAVWRCRIQTCFSDGTKIWYLYHGRAAVWRPLSLEAL